jgi:hypothetical protein
MKVRATVLGAVCRSFFKVRELHQPARRAEAESLRGTTKIRLAQNSPPNRPPTGVSLVSKLIFSRKYLLCNKGVRDSRLAMNQKVACSSHAGRTISSIGSTPTTGANPDPRSCGSQKAWRLIISILVWKPAVMPLLRVKRHIAAISLCRECSVSASVTVAQTRTRGVHG